VKIKKEGKAEDLGIVLLIEFNQKGIECLSCNKVVVTKACIKTSGLRRNCCEKCFLNEEVVEALKRLSINVSMA